ncbi:hypothetical protein Sjap_011775 [Stephania japonica]|uniref:Uncharacterized protein n=1 Tax=Stephania japonica TaxID=461633 RepID=A0AAP0P5A9_9MAGN
MHHILNGQKQKRSFMNAKPSHTLEESTPRVGLNQETNKPVVVGPRDDVVEHHTDMLHDDLHSFEDEEDIVPLTDIQSRLKGKKPLVEKSSKKRKTKERM